MLVLLGLLVLFSIIAPNFATPNNLIILLRQVSFTAISAVGIAFVMIAGGMDLSIGAQISLTNVLAAILMARMGVPPVIAIAFTLALGTFLGVINGYTSILLQQRAAGISPDEIPEADQMELVNLVWNAPEADVLTVGPVFDSPYNWLPEVMGFAKCDRCGELVAHAYRRVVGDQIECIPCSGYDR